MPILLTRGDACGNRPRQEQGEWNLLPDDSPETALRFSTGRFRIENAALLAVDTARIQLDM
jgi:hypothetical protein